MPSLLSIKKILDLDSYRNLSCNSTRLLFIEARLLADEYGLLCASATFLRRRTGSVIGATDDEIEAMLHELQAADLLQIYKVANQRYVYVRSDEVSPRSKRSKWPPPPNSAEFAAQFERSKPAAWSVRRYRHKHSRLMVVACVPDAAPLDVLHPLPCTKLTSLIAAAWADFEVDVVTRGLLQSSAVRRAQKMIAAAQPQNCANRYNVDHSVEQNKQLTEILHTGARSILQAQHSPSDCSILQDAVPHNDSTTIREISEQNQQVRRVIHRNLRLDANVTSLVQLPPRAPASPARIYACASALIDTPVSTVDLKKEPDSYGQLRVVGGGNAPRTEHQKNNCAGRESERGESYEEIGVAELETKNLVVEVAALAKQVNGTRLPANWALTAELLEWTRSHYPEAAESQIAAVAEDFTDYWHAKAGPNAIKVSWSKTWYRWCRNKWGDGFTFLANASTINKPQQTFRQIDIAEKRATMRAWMGKFQLPSALHNDNEETSGVPPKLFNNPTTPQNEYE